MNSRFNVLAENYLKSKTHRSGSSLNLLYDLLGDKHHDVILDIGCGPGHLSRLLNGNANHIIGIDPSEEMLKAFRLNLGNEEKISTIQALSESLPLEENSCDVVMTRFAAHHFSDIKKSLAEMYRVTKRGGLLVIVDLQGYANEPLNKINHELELLHDPSHIYSYYTEEWIDNISSAGFSIRHTVQDIFECPSGLSINEWCALSKSSHESEQVINRLLDSCSSEMIDALGVFKNNEEYHVRVRTLLLIAHKQ